MKSDAQLLREYAQGGSQAAFGEIVTRYTDLVYSAALRQMGAPDLARDVGQNVFRDLARKAPSLVRKLGEDGTLVGWLYRSTRYEALTFLRDERRRQARERPVMQDFDSAPETAPDWERVRPVLDEAMAGLSEQDRQALLLRFFQSQDFQAVGVALGVSDDAAQKRVARALEKLRMYLNRRGGTTTVATLAAALSANAVQTAPAGLAATFTSAALASAAAGAGISFTVLKLMTMAKLKTVLLIVATTAGIVTSIIQYRSNQKLQKENRALLEQNQLLAQLQQENERLSNLVAQTSQPRLSQDQMADLLRLRGEVGRLRSEQQRLAAIGQSKATNRSPAATKAEEPDAQKAFTADLTARIGNGQTLVAGGWSITPGKRTLVLITPGTDRQDIDAGNVNIRSILVEASEESLARAGLESFKSDGRASSLTRVLTGTELKAFKALITSNDVLSAPQVVTADGRPAQVTIGEGSEAVGEHHLPSHVIQFVPHFTADRQAVDFSIQISIQPAGAPASDN